MRTVLLWFGLFVFSTAAHIIAGKWWNDDHPLDTYSEAGRVAVSLAKTGNFSDPFPTMSTGPTAYVAPAYPYLLSLFIRWFGLGHGGWWAIHLITLAASSWQWALLPWLARSWGLPAGAGLLGAATGALLPIPGNCFKWEAVFVGLLLVLLGGLTGVLAIRGGRGYLCLLTGVLWGVALLFSPVLLLPWLGWSVLLAIWLRHKIRWSKLLLLAWVPIAVILPWCVRNYQIFHHVLLVRSNLGFMLGSSNNDCATGWGWGDEIVSCPDLGNPYKDLETARRFATQGEYQFNQHYLQAALTWIEHRPMRFAQLTLLRLRLFWVPPSGRNQGLLAVMNSLAISGLTLLSLPGLYLIFRKQQRVGVILASGFLLYSAIYYVNQLELRYRYPILWMTVFAAAVTVYELRLRLGNRDAKTV